MKKSSFGLKINVMEKAKAESVKLKNLKHLGPKSRVPVFTKWAEGVEQLKKEISKEDSKKMFVYILFSVLQKSLKSIKNPEVQVSANWLRSIGAIKNEFKQ